MSHPMKLSSADALSKIQQINDAQNHMHAILQKMDNEVQQMIQANWHGAQAGRFNESMQTHLTDLRQIGDQTDHLAENAKTAIHQQMQTDA